MLEKSDRDIVGAYGALIQDNLAMNRQKSVFVFHPLFAQNLCIDTYDFVQLLTEVEMRTGTSSGNLLCYFKKILMPIEVFDSSRGYVWEFVEADLDNLVLKGSENRLNLFKQFFQDYLHSIKTRRKSVLKRSNVTNPFSKVNMSGASGDGGCEDNLNLWLTEKRGKPDSEY